MNMGEMRALQEQIQRLIKQREATESVLRYHIGELKEELRLERERVESLLNILL